MRLRHIEVFYHVFREGSISAAARNLYVSQPSVSKVLRHAEDQLGFALFERRKGRLFPTQAARELFDEVSDIYDRVAALDRTAANLKNRKGGHIRIGVLPSLGFSVAPALVADMRRADEDLTFDLATLHSDDVTSALLEKRFDLCLGFDGEFDERIACQTINSVGLALLAREGQFDAVDNVLEPEVLEDRTMIGLRDSGPVADRTELYLEQSGVDPRVDVWVQTHYIAAELVRGGTGCAIVDGFTARHFVDDGVKAYALKGAPTLPFVALYLVENEGQSAVAQCLEAVHRLFG